MAAQKDVLFMFRPPKEDRTVHIDAARMTRALDNLVSNAVKYTPPGGKVEVVAQTGTDYALIHVIDTGIGNPGEDVPHLFDAFYRVHRDNGDDVEGTGLGLSIVKTIIEQHGGQIVVESALGEGSAFSILLTRI
jgi:signal transduction histidine kinase